MSAMMTMVGNSPAEVGSPQKSVRNLSKIMLVCIQLDCETVGDTYETDDIAK